MPADSNHHALPRHHVNWRAAAILDGVPQPVYGHAMETSDSNVVISFENPMHVGQECRIYLDIPDPESGKPAYVDFRAKVLETSLTGQTSQFRHLMQITKIAPEQLAFLKHTLNR